MTQKDRHDEPVTKADLLEFRRGIQEDLNKLRDQLNGNIKLAKEELNRNIEKLRHELNRDIESAKDEVIRYNGILDESLRRDLFGARQQEIAGLEESSNDHERRIARLENASGLVAA